MWNCLLSYSSDPLNEQAVKCLGQFYITVQTVQTWKQNFYFLHFHVSHFQRLHPRQAWYLQRGLEATPNVNNSNVHPRLWFSVIHWRFLVGRYTSILVLLWLQLAAAEKSHRPNTNNNAPTIIVLLYAAADKRKRQALDFIPLLTLLSCLFRCLSCFSSHCLPSASTMNFARFMASVHGRRSGGL